MVLDKEAINSKKLCVSYLEFSQSLINPFGKKNEITALEDVSFSIKHGDVVALIGRNGAGKSTLLKTIAGMLRPSGGKVETFGRVILLAGVDPGFFPDSTGRENILQLAKAYGVGDEEMNNFIDSIMHFANLGDAIDRNFKGYSTGMKGKLGFGFMTALNPDILLIDETLGVGDAEFRKKAQIRLKEFVDRSGSVIISTHSIGLAREICNRGIVIDSGRITHDSEIEEALVGYRKLIG